MPRQSLVSRQESLRALFEEVTVVDEDGKPIQGITVREIWQNYSLEVDGHEMDRQTDANGQVSFPAHRAEYSLLSQIAGSLSAIVRFNAHASYGPHASAHASEESDCAIVSMNQSNNEEERFSAESGERRARAKENIVQSNTDPTQSGTTESDYVGARRAEPNQVSVGECREQA